MNPIFNSLYFIAKQLKPEVKIVTNTPAISMEEVAPVVASDAMLLAPEETHNKNVELKGDEEKTDTDRKRERRAKKLKQRLKANEQEKRKKLVNKLNPGLGNKYAKKKALEDLEKESKSSKNISVINEDAEERTLKSSSAFFSRLHDEVKQQVKSKKGPGEKKKKKSETSISKLKL
jgi:U3 small nucleolar RNA-associated protein MPP10